MSLIVVDQPADRPGFIRETLALLATQLRRDRARLLARVAAASDDELLRGSDDEWGLGQVGTHLLIVQRGVLSIALRLAQGEAVERGTGQPRPAASAVSRAGIAALADKAEASLERFVAAFPSEPDVELTARHPYYGPLNCFGWLLTELVHSTAHGDAVERRTKSAL